MSIATSFATDSPRLDSTDTTVVEQEIDELQSTIERLDADILAAVQLRSDLARRLGLAEAASRASQNREMAALKRFGDLGTEGRTLGMLLLRLGRTAR